MSVTVDSAAMGLIPNAIQRGGKDTIFFCLRNEDERRFIPFARVEGVNLSDTDQLLPAFQRLVDDNLKLVFWPDDGIHKEINEETFHEADDAADDEIYDEFYEQFYKEADEEFTIRGWSTEIHRFSRNQLMSRYEKRRWHQMEDSWAQAQQCPSIDADELYELRIECSELVLKLHLKLGNQVTMTDGYSIFDRIPQISDASSQQIIKPVGPESPKPRFTKFMRKHSFIEMLRGTGFLDFDCNGKVIGKQRSIDKRLTGLKEQFEAEPVSSTNFGSFRFKIATLEKYGIHCPSELINYQDQG